MTIKLKGIGWDHSRGFDCYRDTVPLFQKTHPEIEIEWEARSLRDFGEAPIGPLAEKYDFLVIDHPFSGKARASGCLLDLNELVPDVIAASLKDEVGQSARSYHFDGGVWGLPTDSAAQIAVYRPDLLAQVGSGVPTVHNDVVTLAKELRKHEMYLGLPAFPTDAACLLMTYAANLGHISGKEDGVFLDEAIVDTVLDLLRELVELAHPHSLQSNPIAMHELMVGGDEVAYVPLMFGYSNYSRQGRDPLLKVSNFAGPGKVPYAGTILGGAGCAVSSKCQHPAAAAQYLRWLHQPEILAGAFFEAGGQPGSRAVWLNDAVNAQSNGFFADTLDTLDNSFLRPRFPEFVPFFEELGVKVHAHLSGDITASAVKEFIRSEYNDPSVVNVAG